MSEKATKISPADEGKEHDIAIYLYDEVIDGVKYGGQIVAKDFDDAQRKANSFGANIIGRAIEEMDCQKSVCAVCGGDIYKDLTNPQPIEDEWQEDFE